MFFAEPHRFIPFRCSLAMLFSVPALFFSSYFFFGGEGLVSVLFHSSLTFFFLVCCDGDVIAVWELAPSLSIPFTLYMLFFRPFNRFLFLLKF